ncbi:MAG: sigma 54-interacting transcriptional regulator [Myxococcota bacterium]|jgi:DNA-binding NtrC family response regulator|nr:sigma 54-interacting transcriptional regulator [Myxococcota bacterium]
MELVTVYHHDSPVVRFPLEHSPITVGSNLENDVVLAGDHVAERHLVLYRDEAGCWRAGPPGSEAIAELRPGARLSLGGLALSLDCAPEARRSFPAALPRSGEFGIVGVSAKTRRLRLCIERLAPLRGPVLVCGETGTGKELVASALHLASLRKGAFVAVNCGGLTSSLLEDTLFGHEKGAFTGACAEHRGVFERAHAGTLFLDEIGEIPLSQQAALLRILDDGVVRRVGGRDDRKVEFRLVTATNRNLEKLAGEGRFRLDLFHRLCALRITTSPLRERPEDLEPLAAHFLSLMATEVGHKRLSSEAIRRLSKRDFPGNARQLRNLLYRAAVFSRGPLIRAADLELDESDTATVSLRGAICELSDADVVTALSRHRGNVSGAAKELGVPRTSLRDRIRRL